MAAGKFFGFKNTSREHEKLYPVGPMHVYVVRIKQQKLLTVKLKLEPKDVER